MSRFARREMSSVPLTAAVRAALAKAGYELTADPQLAAVVKALQDDKFILAVKHYRMATGVGLREARDAVKHIETELQATS